MMATTFIIPVIVWLSIRLGEIMYHKKDEEDIFTVELNKEHLENTRAKFPFWKDADNFIITNE